VSRPPADRLSILSRSTHDWIGRINRLHPRFIALSSQQESVARWIELEFVRSVMRLEGVDVAGRIATEPQELGATEFARQAATDISASLTRVRAVVTAEGESASPTASLLISLAAGADYETTRDPRLTSGSEVETARGTLEAACGWFSAESFEQLNAVEQAALVLLRILELRAFDTKSLRVGILAASLFTLRKGLPPLIISEDQLLELRTAIEAGFKMDTAPMVELIARAIEITMLKALETFSS